MKTHKTRIVIVPLGEVDFFMVNKLASNLSSSLALQINIMQGNIKMPTESYNIMRAQYF